MLYFKHGLLLVMTRNHHASPHFAICETTRHIHEICVINGMHTGPAPFSYHGGKERREAKRAAKYWRGCAKKDQHLPWMADSATLARFPLTRRILASVIAGFTAPCGACFFNFA